MKRLVLAAAVILGFAAAFAAPPEGWLIDYDAALKLAKKEKKQVFVLFTGSDWCPGCIRLHNVVLKSPEFREFAKKRLILVYCDFPRRNAPPQEQLQKQQRWSDQLGAGDYIPSVVIVNGDGKVRGRIGGGGMPLAEYMEKLKAVVQ